MRLIVFLFALLSVTTQAFAYGAVAIGRAQDGTEAVAVYVNATSTEKADNGVLTACAQGQVSGCRVVHRFSNGCVGIHRNRNTGRVHYSIGQSTWHAMNEAADRCRAQYQGAYYHCYPDNREMCDTPQGTAQQAAQETAALRAQELKAEAARRQELEAQRLAQEAAERKKAQQAQREADLPRFKPHVIDSANLLSTATKQKLAGLVFPLDTPVIIRTVETLDFSRGPVAADEMMSTEEHWSAIRPRSHWSRWLLGDRSDSTGIYILVSKKPELLQIRYGNRVRFLALRAGLAAGSDYKRLQATTSKGLEAAVLTTATWLAEQAPKMFDVPWYATGANNAIASYGADLGEYALRASVFSTTVLQLYGKLYAQLLNRLQQSVDWVGQSEWLRAVTMTSTAAVLHWTVKAVGAIAAALVFFFVLSRPLKVFFLVAFGILSLLLAIPAIGTLSFLGHGRLEDEMYATALGIVPLSGLVNLDLFSQAPNLLSALALFGLYVLFGITKLDYFRYRSLARMPDSTQQQLEAARGQHELVRALRTGLLLQASDEAEINRRPYAAWARFALLNSILAQNPLKLVGTAGFFICAPLAISLYVGTICLLGIPIYLARSLMRLASDYKLLRTIQFAR